MSIVSQSEETLVNSFNSTSLTIFKEMMPMSGNASRKYKQYMKGREQEWEKEARERRKFFGNISPKGDNGIVDLVAYSAARGEIVVRTTKYNLGKVIVKTKQK